MQKEVIECNTEVAMETKRWTDLVEYIMNKKSSELAHAFHNLWSFVLKVLKIARSVGECNLRTFKTSFVPINKEMHSSSYDFQYFYRNR